MRRHEKSIFITHSIQNPFSLKGDRDGRVREGMKILFYKSLRERKRVEIGRERERVEIREREREEKERSVSKIAFCSSQTVYITREKGEEGKVTYMSERKREREREKETERERDRKRVKEREEIESGRKERENGRRTNNPNVHFRFFDRIQVLIITISFSLP